MGLKGKKQSFNILKGEGEDAELQSFDIELDEGWRIYSRLINCSPEEVVTGLEVEVIFEKLMDRKLPFFQLRKRVT